MRGSGDDSLDPGARFARAVCRAYAPEAVECPSDRPSSRQATSISPEEASWLPARRENTIIPMRDPPSRLDITNLDTESYMA